MESFVEAILYKFRFRDRNCALMHAMMCFWIPHSICDDINRGVLGFGGVIQLRSGILIGGSMVPWWFGFQEFKNLQLIKLF